MTASRVLGTSMLVALLSGCGGGSGSPGTNPGSGGQSSMTGGTNGATGGSVGSGGSGGTATGGAGSGGSGQAGRAGTTGGSGGVGTGGAGTGGLGGRSGTGGTAGGVAGTNGGGGGGGATFNADRAIITGVRGVATPAATRIVQLHNANQSPLSVTALTVSGTNANVFQLVSLPTLPTTIAAGGDLPVTIQLLTASANLPAAPAQDSGATALGATLTATLASGSVSVGLYGLVLTMAIWEPTLGQILNTLGYRNNVGLAQNSANPNRNGTVQTLPGIEPTSDEIAAPRFQKAGTGMVTLLPVARFSPRGPLPFGWYPSAAGPTNCSVSGTMCNMAGTMPQMTDAQTSDKARMVMPPVTGTGTFDPGTQSFGVWVFSDQASKLFPDDQAGAAATNGDYDYSDDALNSPANVHRTKVYPLHDAAGATIANSYLLAIEEAANGDYQDYVFVLGNARVAP